MDGVADAHCSAGGDSGRTSPDHPTIVPAQWRWTDCGYSLQAPTHCGHGHPLGPRKILVGWNNQVPNPCLCWTCRQCGHITWSADPHDVGERRV